MRNRLGNLSYANVTATLALFVALGGTSYAALSLTGANVVNGSLTGADIKRSSLLSSDIKPSTLLSSDIKNGTLRSADFKAGQLPAGPKGDTGAPGANGTNGATNVVTRSTVTSIPPGTSSVTASCAAGEKATGGGVEYPASDPEVRIEASRPEPPTAGSTPTGWVGRVTVSGVNHDITAYVICAAP